jgi:hypothetical protein
MYFMQLEQYLHYFDSPRFLIISSEDLLLNRRETLHSIFRFLNVNETYWSDKFHLIRHSWRDKRRKTKSGMMIHRVFGRRISERLPHPHNHYFRKIIYTPVSKKMVRPNLDPAVRRRLKEVLELDVKKLEDFAGRKFEKWLN